MSNSQRPRGDIGTAQDAIDFVFSKHVPTPIETREFLASWQQGCLDDFPEYFEWLDNNRPYEPLPNFAVGFICWIVIPIIIGLCVGLAARVLS